MTNIIIFYKSFDVIMIISHLDEMKDAAEYQIEIKREGNFSKVVYE